MNQPTPVNLPHASPIAAGRPERRPAIRVCAHQQSQREHLSFLVRLVLNRTVDHPIDRAPLTLTQLVEETTIARQRAREDRIDVYMFALLQRRTIYDDYCDANSNAPS